MTSAFDVLAAALIRGDGDAKLHMIRTFLINKVPLIILAASATSYRPLNLAFLLSEAFMRLSPTMSQTFPDNLVPENNALLFATRRSFAIACSLHGLISRAQTAQLLPLEQSQNLPQIPKAHKETILVDAFASPSKLERMLLGMESMDGNAESYAAALGQVQDSDGQ